MKPESILASQLLDEAASQFSNHGCNDMDPEYFEGLAPDEIEGLVKGFNDWWMGKTGETCGNEEPILLQHIGDDLWMAYLAAVLGRAAK